MTQIKKLANKHGESYAYIKKETNTTIQTNLSQIKVEKRWETKKEYKNGSKLPS